MVGFDFNRIDLVVDNPPARSNSLHGSHPSPGQTCHNNFGRESTTVKLKVLADITALTLLALITLCLAWELWLAPLRPGGSWLVLKALPLLFPFRGVLHGQRYTFQWSSMLILGYFAEGIVRAMSDKGLSTILAIVEITLSLLFFSTAIAYAHISRPSATTVGSVKIT